MELDEIQEHLESLEPKQRIELMSKIISVLQEYENKNERQSYDYLPLSTQGGT